MAKILKPEIKASGIWDAVEMGILKTVIERSLTPVIGNGTLLSGGIKLVAGGVGSGLSQNKHVKLASSATIMDATEDIAHGILSRFFGVGASSDSQNDGW